MTHDSQLNLLAHRANIFMFMTLCVCWGEVGGWVQTHAIFVHACVRWC